MSDPIPDTMRAALLTGIGGPDMLVVRDDVPVPEPRPNEVMIRAAACGVNNTDINTRVGWYRRSGSDATSSDVGDQSVNDESTWGGSGLEFPRIQGADVCGVVVTVGSEVDPGVVGRRVIVDPWIRDADDPDDRSLAGYLGSEYDGGFAEYCTVPARNAHVIESELSDVELASFPCSWSTAEHMLMRVGLSEGQSVAITGASGGVGSALVQLARRRGARVVAVTSRSKSDRVRALGADDVVDRESDSVTSLAREVNGGPFDVVADVVGGSDFAGWLEALGRGGRYVTSGAVAGPEVDLDLRVLYLNDLELFGATVVPRQVFADLVGYIEDGEVEPVVAAVHDLADIHAAQEAFADKRLVGAHVIRI